MKKNRILALFLSGALMLGLLAGCGNTAARTPLPPAVIRPPPLPEAWS